MGGRKLTGQEITDLWEAWTPAEVAGQLSAVTAPWCVAAGWALELFNTEAARPHDDIEIAVPRAHFADIAAAVPGYAWDVAGDGRIWPFPERFNDHHQTWLRDPAAGRYRLDVFREPHIGESWVCRRDPAITLPYSELIRRTHDGIPYATPEVVLLFKAKQRREKDERDYHRVAPHLSSQQRRRLSGWLQRVHPGHSWLHGLD